MNQYYQIKIGKLQYKLKQNYSMLKKYENFVKLSKTQQCSFYEANARAEMNKVLLKRFKSNWSWNQMLKSHALKLQSTQSFTPKVLQIFKHNASYFVVYDRPHGSSLKCAEQGMKFDKDDFYLLFNQLVEYMDKLRNQIQNVYILPQWVFLHRNGIRICHFEPYFEQKKDGKDGQNHVFIYDVLNGKMNSKSIRQSEQRQRKRIKNLNFNLGYIAYHLLTGLTTQWSQDEQDYEKVIKNIRTNGQDMVAKQTSDYVLGSIVARLLNCSDDQITFDQVKQNNHLFDEMKSYLKRKQIECRNCKANRQKFRIVQFSLEKIKLQNKTPKVKNEKKRKCFRQCCPRPIEKQIQPQEQQITCNHKYQLVQKTQPSINLVSSKPKLLTQNSSSPSQTKLKQRTFSNLKTVNRYKIDDLGLVQSMGTERRNGTMFSKTRNFRTRQVVFKHSMGTSHITKTYLKTEY